MTQSPPSSQPPSKVRTASKSRAWLVGLLGVALLCAWWALSVRPTGSGPKAWGTRIWLVQQADGTWVLRTFRFGYRQVVEFAGQVEYRAGPGWQRWETVSQTFLGPPGGPPVPVTSVPGLTARQLETFRQQAWQDAIDNLPHDPLESNRSAQITGYEMLRDGGAVRVDGWTYELRRWFLWIGCGWIVWTIIRALARAIVLGRARLRLRRIERGLCGRCQYPFPRPPSPRGTCSECGADIDADLTAALAGASGGR